MSVFAEEEIIKSDDNELFLKICNGVVTPLSILGAFWTCFYSLKIRSSTNTTLKFIIAITISDLFYSIANLISLFQERSGTFLCMVEAPIREISLRLTLYFSACLALLIFKSSSLGVAFNQTRFFNGCMITCALFILYIASAFFFSGKIENEYKGLNCHYRIHEDTDKTLSYTIFSMYVLIPTAAGILTTLICYFMTYFRIKSIQEGYIEGMGIKAQKLFWYPAVLLLIFGPRLIDGLVKFFTNQQFLFLQALHMILTHSVGLANALVYGYQMKSYYQRYEEESGKRRYSSFLSEVFDTTEFDQTKENSHFKA